MATARLKNQTVALEDPLQATQYQAEGEQIFAAMREMAKQLNAHTEQWENIDDLEEVLMHPELTPAAKLVAKMH
ncbi:gamma-glutamylcysteine synthetase, partial [Levilactobacillus zymae]